MGSSHLGLDPADPSRRSFLGAAALAAVAAVLPAGCGLATGPSDSFSGTFVVKVGDYPGLAATPGIALLQNPPIPLAAVRLGANGFAVFSRRCPHQGGIVNLTGYGFRCPNHGAVFDAAGHNVGGQPTGSLTSFAAVYDPVTDLLTITG